MTQDNLRAAFPGLPVRGLRGLCAAAYRHFGSVAASLATLPRMRERAIGRWLFCDSLEVVEQACAEGRGCLLVSGHLGNWEIGGGATALRGIPTTFIVASATNKLVEELMDRQRTAMGVEVVKRRRATRGILSALRQGRLVAIMIDQDAHEDGAFVPFFGRLASTPRGPAVMHLRTGAPIVFGYSVRLPGERFRSHYERVDTAGITDADELTALLTAKLEAAVRRYPEQWFWMHRRWKSRPAAS